MYAKLNAASGVPTIDYRAYGSSGAIGDDFHTTLLYADRSSPDAERWFRLMQLSANKDPFRLTVVDAYAVADKWLTAYQLGIFDASARQRLSKLFSALKRIKILSPSAGIGDENDQRSHRGYTHMTMYHLPARQEGQNAMLQEMKKLASAKPVVSFGNLYWETRKESAMNKVSFNKVGVDQYRQYLSGLSTDGIAEVFTFGHNDENVKEICERVSAADLAIDEMILRTNHVNRLDDDNYGQNLKRIASVRGIVPDTDEDLFR